MKMEFIKQKCFFDLDGITGYCKNKLTEILYIDSELNQAIKNIEKTHYYTKLNEDLKQDLFLRILELEQSKINDMVENEYVYFFCIKFLTNNVNSDQSPYFKTYKKGTRDVLPINEEIYNLKEEVEEDNIEELKKTLNEKLKILNTMDLYDINIFVLYINGMSVADIATRTKIKPRSVYWTIQKVREKLK